VKGEEARSKRGETKEQDRVSKAAKEQKLGNQEHANHKQPATPAAASNATTRNPKQTKQNTQLPAKVADQEIQSDNRRPSDNDKPTRPKGRQSNAATQAQLAASNYTK